MTVPFMDCAATNDAALDEFLDDVKELFATGQFVNGPLVQRFEEAFAKAIGCKYGVACANGSDGLTMTLRAMGVGAGDEVICPAFGFPSVPEAVARLGATPVFVDVRPDSFTLDADKTLSSINARTRGIVVTHLFGGAADADRISNGARTYSVQVIEDCRQSTGARIGNRRLGTYGTFSVFSFHPHNPLGAAGDAGAVLTNNEGMANTMRKLRDHGRETGSAISDFVGYNSRMDSIQAALLLRKLADLDENNAERIENARLYNKLFAGSPVQTPLFFDDGSHIYTAYTIMVPEREKLVEALKAAEIGQHVPCPEACHLHPAFEYLEYKAGAFPVAEDLARRCVSLPICPSLKKKQIEKVAEAVLAQVGAAI